MSDWPKHPDGRPKKMPRRSFFDYQCLVLARHFLADCIVEEPRTQTQINTDERLLATAIQTAVEDWFSANPIEARS